MNRQCGDGTGDKLRRDERRAGVAYLRQRWSGQQLDPEHEWKYPARCRRKWAGIRSNRFAKREGKRNASGFRQLLSNRRRTKQHRIGIGIICRRRKFEHSFGKCFDGCGRSREHRIAITGNGSRGRGEYGSGSLLDDWRRTVEQSRRAIQYHSGRTWNDT